MKAIILPFLDLIWSILKAIFFAYDSLSSIKTEFIAAAIGVPTFVITAGSFVIWLVKKYS